MTPIYDRLLELPLFQGHSRQDLTSILEKIKVDFRTYRDRQAIVRQDDPCGHIILIMEGQVKLSRSSLHKDLIFTEQFSSPCSLGAETLFGLRQSYSHTATAVGEVRTLLLSKQSVIDQLFAFDVFRYNLLNMLTTRIQRSSQLLWAPDEGRTLERFIALMKRNFIYHGGPKQIEGGMVALAKMMNDTRINISNMLNALQQQGLITLGRKHILIPHLEEVIHWASKS